MKKKMKRLFFIGATCALAVTPMAGSPSISEQPILSMSQAYAATLAKTNVYVVGDSTACIYKEDEKYAIPRAGWGMYLQNYLDGKATVVDLALSGRSSKSFTTEKNYEKLKSSLKEGDYLIIQFGHNDAKRTSDKDKAERYTDPLGTIDTVGSFKNSLYANYIKLAREKGATAILISPVSRMKFDPTGKTEDTHEDYDDAVRALAKETNTPMIDMTAITADYYNQLGPENTKMMHAVFIDVTKKIDGTHYSHYGANVIASKVASELSKLNVDLKNYVIGSSFTADGNTYITKGDYAVLLTRALTLSSSNTSDSFTDVPKDYRGKYISIAKSFGIVNGYNDGSMGYGEYLTRQDAAAIAYRALSKVKNLGSESKSNIQACSDYSSISSYATDAVAFLVNNGYMSLKNGKVAPFEKLTKEEAEKIAVSFYEIKTNDLLEKLTNPVTKMTRDELEKVE